MTLIFSPKAFFYFFFGLIIFACKPIVHEEADILIKNANIWTGDPDLPFAKAMAIKGDTILSIGDLKMVLQTKGPKTDIIDVTEQMVVPGFIDSHVHLMTGGRSLLSVDLRNAESPKIFTEKVGNFAETLEAGEWILEGNWDHTLWGGELPHKDWVDAVTQDNPILLFRLDWHMALANSAALKYAGIDENTKDIEGGTIVKDKNGELTGILKDNAMNLVLDKMPPMTLTQKDKSFQAAIDYFLSNGVTSVHDVDGLNKDFESYTTALKYRSTNKLKIRIYAATPLNEWQQLANAKHNNDNWLKTGALKGFVDGSLGSHTAAFHNHYTDKEDDKGFFINVESDLYEWIAKADSAKLHVLVHAIGDSANHVLLNTFEKIIKENGSRDRRFRIEHAQHLLPDDIQRFKDLSIIPSMQPYHAIDDGRWAEQYIGAERIKTSYAFNALEEAGASLAFGSDWAVAPAAPIMGIYAAVTRQTLDGLNPNGWVPEQKITVQQALEAYTHKAAYASYDEKIKGSLTQGKLADFVILSDNLFEVKPDDIKDVSVEATFVGGQRVYRRNRE